ncbi:helix-turn-helix domain-containing protein [Natrarchaeobius sp. A-rgal3]|uniref:helix-turn-helix domain-containing protein n=1 Tax=Natrarchaeobius versutus TaxID=1679078 RepID=UPI0035105283
MGDPGLFAADWSPRDRRTSTSTSPFADPTDKQRYVVRHAYHEGCFERPRGATAKIAEHLGIARQTFVQHSRAAQRKVLGSYSSH